MIKIILLLLQEKLPEIKSNEGNKMPTENLNVSTINGSNNNNSASPRKSPSKAPLGNIGVDAIKVEKAQPAIDGNNNKNITNNNDGTKKPEDINDGSNDDDDDSVFLKDETSTKHKSNVSSVKSSNVKTLTALTASTQNLVSRELNVQSETVVR